MDKDDKAKLIETAKSKILLLQLTQDDIFKNLIDDLGLDEDTDDELFDVCYNGGDLT